MAAETKRWRKGSTSQEIQAASRSRKGKETDSSLRASRRNQLCPQLDFSPVKLISDL